jgi:hypothetical protein
MDNEKLDVVLQAALNAKREHVARRGAHRSRLGAYETFLAVATPDVVVELLVERVKLRAKVSRVRKLAAAWQAEYERAQSEYYTKGSTEHKEGYAEGRGDSADELESVLDNTSE